MLNYMIADIRRILKKPSFLLAVGVFMASYLLLVFIKSGPSYGSEALIQDVRTLMTWFPFMVGLPIFLSVFADDFSTKAMYVAMGFGLSRRRLLLAKLLEVFILSLFWAVLIFLMVSLLSTALGLSLSSGGLFELGLILSVEVCRLLGFTSLCLPLVFFFQGMIEGLIVYVLLSSKMLQLMLSMLLSREVVTNLVGDLSSYLLTPMIYDWQLNLLGKKEVLLPQLGLIALYLLLPFLVAMQVFEQKELEF